MSRLRRLVRVLARGFDLALVRIELLLNSSLAFRLLTVRMRLKRKPRVAEFADPDYRNIPHALDDAKIALCHSSIVS